MITYPSHRASNPSSSFFLEEPFCLGVEPVWLGMLGKLSAAAALSARNFSNSVLVTLSSGPSSAVGGYF